jgi:uncharacterized membrane protein YphA (DoxX/SURF4 family)
MPNQKIASWLLRLGLAGAFLYVAVASWLDPFSWIGFFPQFLRDLMPAQTLLTLFSVYEIVLGLWLLLGKQLFYAGLLSAATLIGIVVFNLGAMDILFRDVSLSLAALALAALSNNKES